MKQKLYSSGDISTSLMDSNSELDKSQSQQSDSTCMSQIDGIKSDSGQINVKIFPKKLDESRSSSVVKNQRPDKNKKKENPYNNNNSTARNRGVMRKGENKKKEK